MRKLKSSVIISLVLFSATMAASQNPEIDSLELAFRTARTELFLTVDVTERVGTNTPSSTAPWEAYR